jgi:hypothetical protein
MRGWKMTKDGHMLMKAGIRGSMVLHRRRITKTSVIHEVKLHGKWVKGNVEQIKSFVKMIQVDQNESN